MSTVVKAPAVARGFIHRCLLLANCGERIEIRSLTKPVLSKTGTILEVDAMVATAARWGQAGRNVYWCLNPIRGDYRDERGTAVRDADIIRRARLLIDCDSIRPDHDAPATEAEAEAALAGLSQVVAMLRDHFQFPDPMFVVSSGNGGQAIYEVDLPADEETTGLVKRFLVAVPTLMGPLFVGCQIDPVVSNLSRLARLPGTTNHKPKADDERPNRMAQFLKINYARGLVTEDMLREVVAVAAELEAPITEDDPAEVHAPAVNGSRHAGPAAAPGEAYVRKALAGECDKIRGTKPGGRHGQIRSSAIAVGGFLACEVVTRAEMESALVAAAVAIGKTEAEATKLVAWGLDRGAARPRTMPEPRAESNGKHAPDPPTADPPTWQLDVRRASSYRARPMKFLSKPRLPRGIVITLGGAGGEGKSVLTEHVAADLSRGRPTLGSDVAYDEPVDVLMLACEDGREDALIPRLIAAGADLDRIEIIEGLKNDKGERQAFDITYLPYLRRYIEEGNAAGRRFKLIVIDPITTYVGRAKIDDHRDAQLKPALEGLVKIAQDLDVTFVCLAHLNKGGSGKSAAFRIMGGAAYVTSSRLTYVYAADPDNAARRILASPKANIPGGKPPALAVRIDPLDPAEALVVLAPHVDHLDENDRSELASQLFRLSYEGPVDTTAEALLDQGLNNKESRKEKALDFLREILEDGKPIPSNSVYAEGKKRGISRSAIWDAKGELDIQACKVTEGGMTAWNWLLKNPDDFPDF